MNHPLAEQLGLDPAELDSAEGAQVLAGNVLPDGAASIALVYAGHQFGGFSQGSAMVARSCWVRCWVGTVRVATFS